MLNKKFYYFSINYPFFVKEEKHKMGYIRLVQVAALYALKNAPFFSITLFILTKSPFCNFFNRSSMVSFFLLYFFFISTTSWVISWFADLFPLILDGVLLIISWVFCNNARIDVVVFIFANRYNVCWILLFAFSINGAVFNTLDRIPSFLYSLKF